MRADSQILACADAEAEHRDVGADPSEGFGIRGSELAIELEARTQHVYFEF